MQQQHLLKPGWCLDEAIEEVSVERPSVILSRLKSVKRRQEPFPSVRVNSSLQFHHMSCSMLHACRLRRPCRVELGLSTHSSKKSFMITR